jgi:predicted metal-dependent enzyme (double-stranded beta helix superfamily)
MTVISMDGSDPASWDPKLDALVAAPGNHRLLYEDDAIRVLSVSVAPGEKEPVHHHRWPSVFVIDRLVKLRDFDGEGREIPLPIPDQFEPPLTVKLPPQPLHSVRNEDTLAFHGTRIEFKRGFPANGR